MRIYRPQKERKIRESPTEGHIVGSRVFQGLTSQVSYLFSSWFGWIFCSIAANFCEAFTSFKSESSPDVECITNSYNISAKKKLDWLHHINIKGDWKYSICLSLMRMFKALKGMNKIFFNNLLLSRAHLPQPLQWSWWEKCFHYQTEWQPELQKLEPGCNKRERKKKFPLLYNSLKTWCQ